MENLANQSSRHAERFVEFVLSMGRDEIPQRVIQQAKACILDSIACGLFGSRQPWGEIMASNTVAESAEGPCTVLGYPNTLAAAPAALVNGTAIHGYELDDLIVGAVVHPGAVILPAALAACELSNASGLKLLLGVIAGYEAMARLSLALGAEPSQRGFHVTAVVGPIGATIAAGVTMGLAKDDLLAAVGLACSASSGIKSFAGGSGGGMVKRMHAGRSAEAGVRMCQLAVRGFSGPRAAIDGRFGLLEVFGGKTANAERLCERLGDHWATDDIWVKLYPMCGGIHTAAQLLEQLRGDVPLRARDIAAVRVGVSKFAAKNNGDPAPVDTMGAQYSIPYCAAVALLADPKDPAMFSDSAMARPEFREVASRVALFVDDKAESVYPNQLGARVELHLTGGEIRTSVALDAHGTPADPCSDAERRERFLKLGSAALPPATLKRLLDVIQRLDALPAIGLVTDALRESADGVAPTSGA
ncbi:MAG: MmgE/PrpD family protein [Betaproteobacteria bacterium]|nr:MmgE/PrpD family protein [Betaproteobacteria bacterium]